MRNDITRENVLDKIIELDGHCLAAEMCEICPFNNSCLIRFFENKNPPSRQERVAMALDAIVYKEIMKDERKEGIQATLSRTNNDACSTKA